MNADLADFPDWNSHPLFGDFHRRTEPHAFRDHSNIEPCPIAVHKDGKLVALVAATNNHGQIDHYGLPLRISLHRGLRSRDMKTAFVRIFDKMKNISQRYKGGKVIILGGECGEAPSAIDQEMIRRMATPSLRIHGISDLSTGQATVQRSIRKSYRSLINWGRKNLKMHYITATNLDHNLFQLFPTFHSRIAGRVHYGTAFWREFWHEIVNGKAELSLGFIDDDKLATAVFIADAGLTSYYGSGVFDRAHFDKSISHFPLYDAMLRASDRGIKIFDLGELHPLNSGVSEKEVQIGYFKRGFASNFTRHTVWELSL